MNVLNHRGLSNSGRQQTPHMGAKIVGVNNINLMLANVAHQTANNAKRR
jgi:hypothetical protein